MQQNQFLFLLIYSFSCRYFAFHERTVMLFPIPNLCICTCACDRGHRGRWKQEIRGSFVFPAEQRQDCTVSRQEGGCLSTGRTDPGSASANWEALHSSQINPMTESQPSTYKACLSAHQLACKMQPLNLWSLLLKTGVVANSTILVVDTTFISKSQLCNLKQPDTATSDTAVSTWY